MNSSELIVAACLWPCLSYCVGSALAFAARHWAWCRWLRPCSASVLGMVANVIGGALACLAATR